jgi:hypothetical protein
LPIQHENAHIHMLHNFPVQGVEIDDLCIPLQRQTIAAFQADDQAVGQHRHRHQRQDIYKKLAKRRVHRSHSTQERLTD